ncbi:hypothetical protein AX16_010893 [Volvariella volvacea WC 439]|nr:hypothetical protein AX16_010893 [Volvariella volvacea WC 439]
MDALLSPIQEMLDSLMLSLAILLTTLRYLLDQAMSFILSAGLPFLSTSLPLLILVFSSASVYFTVWCILSAMGIAERRTRRLRNKAWAKVEKLGIARRLGFRSRTREWFVPDDDEMMMFPSAVGVVGGSKVSRRSIANMQVLPVWVAEADLDQLQYDEGGLKGYAAGTPVIGGVGVFALPVVGAEDNDEVLTVRSVPVSLPWPRRRNDEESQDGSR